MTLTAQDIDSIEARAELIAERVSDRVITRVLTAHIASCPHGRLMETWKQRLIGMALLAVLVGISSGAGTALILKAF